MEMKCLLSLQAFVFDRLTALGLHDIAASLSVDKRSGRLLVRPA
jgi:hypothetical protein